ncbi:hypothetical protein CALCODRAFT_301178 [Calocera cornea HHB12733]|uniref:Uncharacterized protein n=1 Tax=Calocera cornea HHB12733 TaxID=1353952 RepID=A0A165FI13_9BASI|nr:hypothetical protein CALCODRAFT_301178 [Calocera cornea HHB12733]
MTDSHGQEVVFKRCFVCPGRRCEPWIVRDSGRRERGEGLAQCVKNREEQWLVQLKMRRRKWLGVDVLGYEDGMRSA